MKFDSILSSAEGVLKSEDTNELQDIWDIGTETEDGYSTLLSPEKNGASVLGDPQNPQNKEAPIKTEYDVCTTDCKETIMDSAELGSAEQLGDDLSTEFEAVMENPLKYQDSVCSGTMSDSDEQPKTASQYQCTTCARIFKHSRAYEKHKMTHPCNQPLTCEICGKGWGCEDSLKDHVMREHIDNESNLEKLFSCHVCGVGFNSEFDLEMHTKMLTCKKSFSCEGCGEKFLRKKSLIEHIKTHPNMFTHRRKICGKASSNLENMEAHLNLRRFSCDKCGKTYAQKSTVNRHMRMHSSEKPFRCNICGANFALERNLANHSIACVAGKKLFKCDDCQKIFMTFLKLRQHMRVHNIERPYSCRICSKSFPAKYNLKRHLMTHTGEKPYHCRICGKTFSWKHNALQHAERMHENNEPLSCDVCGKRFSMKYSLREHLKMHTDGLLSCVVCGQIFSQKSLLRDHIRSFHAGERPFSCGICNKSYAFKEHLKRHSLTHIDEKAHSCNVCGKFFNYKSDLKMHLKVHTDEIRFPCEFCSKHFSTKSNMKTHRLKHKINASFPCEFCSKHFSTKSNMKTHRLKHEVNASFPCDFCHRRFMEESALNIHVKRMHPSQRRIKKKESKLKENRVNRSYHLKELRIILKRLTDDQLISYSKDRSNVKDRNISPVIFKCQPDGELLPRNSEDGSCSSETDSKELLKIHVGKESFSCEVCSENFIGKHSLMSHKLTHSDEKSVESEIREQIDMTNNHSSNLKKEPTHFDALEVCSALEIPATTDVESFIEEKFFFCYLCEKSFTCRSELQAHSKIHTREKLIPCNVCGNGSIAKIRSPSYVRIRGGEETSCQACGRKFIQEGHLRKHRRKRTDDRYECADCGKSFAVKNLSKRHTSTTNQFEIGAGTKRFSCTFCGKVSAHRKQMNSRSKGPAEVDCFPIEISMRGRNFQNSVHHHASDEKTRSSNSCEAFNSHDSPTELHESHSDTKPLTCDPFEDEIEQKNNVLVQDSLTHDSSPPNVEYAEIELQRVNTSFQEEEELKLISNDLNVCIYEVVDYKCEPEFVKREISEIHHEMLKLSPEQNNQSCK